jgi:hypothetical protein
VYFDPPADFVVPSGVISRFIAPRFSAEAVSGVALSDPWPSSETVLLLCSWNNATGGSLATSSK